MIKILIGLIVLIIGISSFVSLLYILGFISNKIFKKNIKDITELMFEGFLIFMMLIGVSALTFACYTIGELIWE